MSKFQGMCVSEKTKVRDHTIAMLVTYLCHHFNQQLSSDFVGIPNIEDMTIGSSRLFVRLKNRNLGSIDVVNTNGGIQHQ
jgi:hypothetical protein